MNQDKLFAEERRELETKEFEAMIGFVNSKLDTIFESCGIVCQKMIGTNVCGIIYCWTFKSVNPRTPTQRVRIREALERMIEQLPYAGFVPYISHISFPGAGVHLVHLEIYPREFDSIKARFEEIRRRAIECPECANAWWLHQYVILAKEYWQIRVQLMKDYEHGCGFIPRNEAEVEKWKREKERECDWEKLFGKAIDGPHWGDGDDEI